ncbi:MAG: hypothetical protein WBA13_03440 [Microcoleaceae cyanobacterium]
MKLDNNPIHQSTQPSQPKNNKVAPKKLKNKIFWGVSFLFYALIISGGVAFINRYKVSEEMQITVDEFSAKQYPAEPANYSTVYNRYGNRQLKIIEKENNHFDFILEPTDSRTAKIVIKNINLELFVPKVPEVAKNDNNLELISLVSREWNRQQVSFPSDSEHLEITGGDGFEKENLYSVELARNCLNSGLWEVFLNVEEQGNKAQYYHGWFDFPLGQYKKVFENINSISYWKHWLRLEKWQNPAGKTLDLELLRTVITEVEVEADFPEDERIIIAGEQTRKIRNIIAKNLITWKDFYQKNNQVRFATFRKPGFYDPKTPWGNQYWRIGQFEKAILRDIQSQTNNQELQEIELVFSDTRNGDTNKIIVGGIDLQAIPQLPTTEYNKGLYRPIGISLTPFSQSYEELKENPPENLTYYSAILDAENRWIDNHSFGVDGVVMHRDAQNPNLLHAYLLSYERHTLISHYLIDLENRFSASANDATTIPAQPINQAVQATSEDSEIQPIFIIPTEQQWSCYHQGKGGKACFLPSDSEAKPSES